MKQRNPKFVEIRHREQRDNCLWCKTSRMKKKMRDAVSRSFKKIRSVWKNNKEQ